MRYRVKGLATKTGEDTEIAIEAPNADQARVYANRRGIAVSSVTALEPPKAKTPKWLVWTLGGIGVLGCLGVFTNQQASTGSSSTTGRTARDAQIEKAKADAQRAAPEPQTGEPVVSGSRFDPPWPFTLNIEFVRFVPHASTPLLLTDHRVIPGDVDSIGIASYGLKEKRVQTSAGDVALGWFVEFDVPGGKHVATTIAPVFVDANGLPVYAPEKSNLLVVPGGTQRYESANVVSGEQAARIVDIQLATSPTTLDDLRNHVKARRGDR